MKPRHPLFFTSTVKEGMYILFVFFFGSVVFFADLDISMGEFVGVCGVVVCAMVLSEIRERVEAIYWVMRRK